MASSDKKTISTADLCVGMYVSLPTGWLDHPFLTNTFLIKTDDQLQRLKNCKMKNVDIILSKSRLQKKEKSTEKGGWTPDKIVPPQLAEVLSDRKAPPEKRSEAVYGYSKELMSRLLESPSAGNIKASKSAISSITDLILSNDRIADSMLKITSHDFYTYTHSVNVGVTSIMLAKALFGKSDKHDMHELGAGFFLHDIGKTAVDQAVINKPGRLDEEELKNMQKHPAFGYKILQDCDELSEEAKVIILQHHERADGTGYPKGLCGDQIHDYAKICVITDVFDALTAERSYKKAMTSYEALKLMKEKMIGHFDKEMFIKFIEINRT